MVFGKIFELVYKWAVRDPTNCCAISCVHLRLLNTLDQAEPDSFNCGSSPPAKAVPLIKASRSGALCLIGEDIFSAFRAIEVVRLRPADQIGHQYHIRAEGGLERLVHEAELVPAQEP